MSFLHDLKNRVKELNSKYKRDLNDLHQQIRNEVCDKCPVVYVVISQDKVVTYRRRNEGYYTTEELANEALNQLNNSERSKSYDYFVTTMNPTLDTKGLIHINEPPDSLNPPKSLIGIW